MTRSPTVAFGLNVTSAALNAKCGRTSVHARLALATATLKLVPMDEAACGAVLEFLETAERCPVTAGRGLQGFVIDWLDSGLWCGAGVSGNGGALSGDRWPWPAGVRDRLAGQHSGPRSRGRRGGDGEHRPV